MKEKVLDNKKNGMGMMVLFILLYAVAAAAVIFGAAFEQIPLMVIGIIWASLGWIPFLGPCTHLIRQICGNFKE